jgi:large subunit ribosomal protein L36e
MMKIQLTILTTSPTTLSLVQKLNKRVAFVRDVVRDVAGYAPYEKRTMELLKVGKEKRALRVLKTKLGTHKRAKAKREQMADAARRK